MDDIYTYQAWPAWYYGPDGQSAIFSCAEEVPAGWMDYDTFIGFVSAQPGLVEDDEQPQIEELFVEDAKPKRGRPRKTEESDF